MNNKKLDIEKRSIEFRSENVNEKDGQMIVDGYGAVFDSPTVLFEADGVEYKEVIDRHALDNADFSLCCLKYNHENNVPVLARTRNGSLKTEIDNYGLKFSAILFNTTAARDVYTIIKEGGLDKCSFAFTVKSSEYDRLTHTRTILEIDKVFDISIVDIPAYDTTDVKARSFFEMEIEKERQELENEAEKRKRLILLSY